MSTRWISALAFLALLLPTAAPAQEAVADTTPGQIHGPVVIVPGAPFAVTVEATYLQAAGHIRIRTATGRIIARQDVQPGTGGSFEFEDLVLEGAEDLLRPLRELGEPFLDLSGQVPFTAVHGSVRFSLSHYTTDEEIDTVIDVFPEIVASLRRLDYTVIGDVVNLASRLCDSAKQQRSGVLASAATVDAAGITAPKIMIRAWLVTRLLYRSGSTSWIPGRKSSARMTMAKKPPRRNMAKENHRYMVPMSLWLVLNNQRPKPLGGSSW